MHVAAGLAIFDKLLPVLSALRTTLEKKSVAFADIVKIGRTHLQGCDAPGAGPEFSGYVAQMDHAQATIAAAMPALCELAVGGIAMDTGLNRRSVIASRQNLPRKAVCRLGAGRRQQVRRWRHTMRWWFAHGALKTLATRRS